MKMERMTLRSILDLTQKKGSDERMFVFSMKEEDNIVEWWHENKIFYNPQHPMYIDKGRKEHIIQVKAKEFGCPRKYMMYSPPKNI